MSLTNWRDISDPTTRVIACVGDSTTEIGWPAILRDIVRPRWGYGGFGVRHMGKEWVPSMSGGVTTWTKGGSTDAWNIGFQTNGFYSNLGTWLANGAANIQTWTKPDDCPAITSFDLLVCDGSGAGNFSYSIDGGAWTNVSTSWLQANAFKTIPIASTVVSTVAVRAANASGTGVNTYMIGIEPHCSTTGVKIHDISASGSFSNSIIRTGNTGDWTAWWNIVRPQLVFMNFVNDFSLYNGSQYQARWDAFGAMVTGYGGTVVYYSYFEFGTSSTANQDDGRSRIYTVAQKYGGNYYDLKALFGDFATVSAAGIIGSDNTHPTPRGSRLMANCAWNMAGPKLYADKLVRI